jgi:hypothetical protein
MEEDGEEKDGRGRGERRGMRDGRKGERLREGGTKEM